MLVIASLFLLVTGPKVPIVAWLPPVTKEMAMYSGEPETDRGIISGYSYSFVRGGLQNRYDGPDVLKWQASMAKEGVNAVVNGDPVPPVKGTYPLQKAMAAGRDVGADILAMSRIMKAERNGGGNNTYVTLYGDLTLIDLKTNNVFVNTHPLFQSDSVAGPFPQVVDPRGPAHKFATALQLEAAIRIKHYLAGKTP